VRSKWKLVFTLLAVAALAVAASGGGAATKPPLLAKYKFKGATFTVGSKEFTEQKILGEITKQALKATGAKVKDQLGLNGSAVVRAALLSGKIDMYWEYTGTGWIVHLNHTKPITKPLAQYRAVAKEDKGKGVQWLAPAPLNNTYAFALRKEAVSKLGGITKISQLKTLIANQPKEATICVASEFSTRDDGLPGVEKTYGFKFPKDNIVLIELGTIYKSVDDGKICNFGEVFATDGRIQGLGLKVLKDDKNFFPVYNAALNVRLKVFRKYPKLAPMFKLISAKLTNGVMTQMNADVDVRGKFPDEVAKAFLKKYKFIK
jgi:osmoprotectant transport system substrate-binding protein